VQRILVARRELGIESVRLERKGEAPSNSAKESWMPHYLIQVAYNTRGLQGLVKEPQDRIEKVRPAIEAVGGRIESAYYAFGEHDIVLICEMPDNAAAAAFALAVGAGGTVSSYRTTVLLTSDEAMEAMRAAGESTYTPAPG
jgi:uncharacterized protein with GYD domain